jgi:hypothetical protein
MASSAVDIPTGPAPRAASILISAGAGGVLGAVRFLLGGGPGRAGARRRGL